jgi:hypothetical protein
MLEFTKDKPCRCGFDGTGVHQCHAGRNPLAPGERCPNEAAPRLVAYLACLAGAQMKLGASLACYCDACHAEAFPPKEVS